MDTYALSIFDGLDDTPCPWCGTDFDVANPPVACPTCGKPLAALVDAGLTALATPDE